ncbi:carbamoyl phosphate synthase small subunit [Alkalibacillus haloalkaliphilus]|uniref:Carbamoyl phosphate synthase small chain n=1 Tax=Alkalibacillus haloalkaliphilus TaxID=94136 RepID=A0A511W1C4_9BACI|nr:carbamoyl phosphate synthase small subunit [Alkalibacillus haloalkaliphilus]GEN44844.1 carbamoyl-phosphate synthase pyrimidine-specific small chain [Alkalibacillus haloalkaliphilus]
MSKRYLLLEDGTIYEGRAFGAEINDYVGEVVFQTGMTGYQETLSDPSYCGQMVVMTYPLIGNYGINRDDFETVRPALKALIVKEAENYPSNFRSEMSISQFLSQKGVPGIEGIDTRSLVKKIRRSGTMKGILIDDLANLDQVIDYVKQTALPKDQVSQVSAAKPYVVPGRGLRVVLVDYGMKHGILRELTERGCHITVVPYDTTADEVMQLQPDGIMLSNGPGDPKDVLQGIDLVEDLLGKVPIFGICLGHQLISLACGANTERLKFGHRGANHPVKVIETGEAWMTSQNHGYTVSTESIEHTKLKVTHQAINDGSVEGVEHESLPIFSVQFHPESSPGPSDANVLFDHFLNMMKENKLGGVTSCQKEQIFVGS